MACIEDKGIGCESGTAKQVGYGTNQIIWDEGFLGLPGLGSAFSCCLTTFSLPKACSEDLLCGLGSPGLCFPWPSCLAASQVPSIGFLPGAMGKRRRIYDSLRAN